MIEKRMKLPMNSYELNKYCKSCENLNNCLKNTYKKIYGEEEKT